jgi:uncharacterized protein (UPF0335 family)
MDTWVSEIAHIQSTVMQAVRSGEPESSPRLRQLVARLERLENLCLIHRTPQRVRAEIKSASYDYHA